MSDKFLYVFLDEAGDFGFHPNGSKYFLLTSIAKERPFTIYQGLADLKYDLAESGLTIEYFHAAEDKQAVRDQVFAVIQNHLASIRIDSLIIEKRKTFPTLQQPEKFYPKMLGYLLCYVLKQFDLKQYSKFLIFTDHLPLKRKRDAVQKAIKTTLSAVLPGGAKYEIFHHASKSNFNLQVVDYCSWAIYRKWKDNDTRSYDLVRTAIKSEFDIFCHGTRFHY